MSLVQLGINSHLRDCDMMLAHTSEHSICNHTINKDSALQHLHHSECTDYKYLSFDMTISANQLRGLSSQISNE